PGERAGAAEVNIEVHGDIPGHTGGPSLWLALVLAPVHLSGRDCRWHAGARLLAGRVRLWAGRPPKEHGLKTSKRLGRGQFCKQPERRGAGGERGCVATG